jgi:hypothetical protein
MNNFVKTTIVILLLMTTVCFSSCDIGSSVTEHPTVRTKVDTVRIKYQAPSRPTRK